MERLPFEFTAPVVRYLGLILDEYKKYNLGKPLAGKERTTVVVDTYEKGEDVMSYWEENRILFSEYLKTRGTQIRDWGEKVETVFRDRLSSDYTGNQLMAYPPEQLLFVIHDISVIQKLWSHFEQHKNTLLLKPIHYGDELEVKYFQDARRIVYRSHLHTIQRGKDGLSKRLGLFEMLWENRRHSFKGKEQISGNPVSFAKIEDHLGYGESSQIVSDLKNLDSTLRKKGFPIRISHKGKKAFLTVEEKG